MLLLISNLFTRHFRINQRREMSRAQRRALASFVGGVYTCMCYWGEDRESPPTEGFPGASLTSFKTNYVSATAATLMKWRRDVSKALCETDQRSVGADRWSGARTCWSSRLTSVIVADILRGRRVYRLRRDELGPAGVGDAPPSPPPVCHRCPRTPAGVAGALLCRRRSSVTALTWAWSQKVPRLTTYPSRPLRLQPVAASSVMRAIRYTP